MIAVDSKGSYGGGLPPYSGAAIQVKNLWKKYGDTEAVRGISCGSGYQLRCQQR